MTVPRKFVTLFLVPALLFLQACTKKKPVLRSQGPAPTIAETLPDEIPEQPTPDMVPTPTVTLAEKSTAKSKPKKTARTAGNNSNKKSTNSSNVAASSPPASSGATATQTPGSANNTQTVATARPPRTTAPVEIPQTRTTPPENTPDLAIAAAIPSAQVSQQKEDTVRMVDATENALKGINRSLSDNEKAMRTQIQSYLQQSRKATVDGDFERAYNLAKKAQLLADALVKK